MWVSSLGWTLGKCSAAMGISQVSPSLILYSSNINSHHVLRLPSPQPHLSPGHNVAPYFKEKSDYSDIKSLNVPIPKTYLPTLC